MTREEYIKYLNDGYVGNITYEYYKQKFDKEKHKPELNLPDFIKYLQFWCTKPENPDPDYIINTIIDNFNVKFSVVKLTTNKKVIYI